MSWTEQVELECGHTAVLSLKSLRAMGYPIRWWCPSCRTARDLPEKFAGKQYQESQ